MLIISGTCYFRTKCIQVGNRMGCKQDVSDYKEQKRGCCEDPELFRFIHFQLGATVKKVSLEPWPVFKDFEDQMNQDFIVLDHRL